MKTVRDLKPGDVIVQDGIRFVVRFIENMPNGNTAILFEDMPATEENMAAYGALMKKAIAEKEGKQVVLHEPANEAES
jgi:hypothetical protein